MSNYSFPLSPLRRTLTPIAGYDAGDDIFTVQPGSLNISYSDGNSFQNRGGVLAPNGKIVFVPSHTVVSGSYKAHIGIFDPASQAADRPFTTIDITDQVAGLSRPSASWLGGVLAPNGKVYFVPAYSHHVGKFDPSDNTFSTIDISDKESSDWKYHGGVLANNDKIYFVPHNADNVGVFDPSDDSFETVSISVSQSWKYSGGVLAPNGKIVFVPWSTWSVGVFDPSDNSFNTYAISGTSYINYHEKFVGGVLTPDGKVVLIPRFAKNIGLFDPSDNTFSVVAEPGVTYTNLPGFHGYAGGVLAPNGKVIFVPNMEYRNNDAIGVFNPSDRSFTTITGLLDKMRSDFVWRDWPNQKAGYWGGVLAPNGKIVFVPGSAGSHGGIGILDLGNQDLAYSVSGGIHEGWSSLLSPHFNKYP